jgi:hypothetical protein
MRRLLPLLTLPFLTGCFQTSGPSVQAVTVTVPAAVIAACGSVTWSDAAIPWKDDQTLGDFVALRFDGASPSDPSPDGLLAGRSLHLSKTGGYTVLNTRATRFTSLESTLKCDKTGQSVTARADLTGGRSAFTTLTVTNGQLAATWTPG